MNGKKPHLDFASRSTLNGSEELYSQNAAWDIKEQKFTLAQVRTWILEGQIKEQTQVFFAEMDNQLAFQLNETALLPELSEVWFEKLKLTYGESYRIEGDSLKYTGTDFQICEGEQVEIRYLFKENIIV